jgi:hypothetical protein
MSGKFINMADQTTIVKSVVSSQAIYHLTQIIIPLSVTNNMKKMERNLLWSASDKVSGGQCKVNWEILAIPNPLEGAWSAEHREARACS